MSPAWESAPGSAAGRPGAGGQQGAGSQPHLRGRAARPPRGVVVRARWNRGYRILRILRDVLGVTKENFQTFLLTPARCPHCLRYLIFVPLPQPVISVQPQVVLSKTDSMQVCRRQLRRIRQVTVWETWS